MKAHEFQTQLKADGTLTVPPALAEQIRCDVPVRVMLLIPDDNEDTEWTGSAAAEFLKGYADGDAIYDELRSG